MPYFPPAGSGGGDGGPAVDQIARDAAASARSVANTAQGSANDALTKANSAYQFPAGGITPADLAQVVRDTLAQAESAVQAADLTKAAVGLGNVDNTSDASKPVSTAQATALGLRVPTSRTVGNGTGLTGGGDLTQDRTLSLTPAVLTSLGRADSAFQKDPSGILLADLHPTIVASLSNANSAIQPGGLTKAAVGLSDVDNTSDSAKPVSAATQTALNAKAPLSSPTFTGTVGGITKSMVGLGSVDNTSDSAKPVSTAQQAALDLKASLASPTFTGTVGGITKAMVGLGNVDNTADTAKPVSTAQQTALNAKAPIASPTFTGTVGGITAAMVGLGNVNNTSDANKPVSTAQATALAAKVASDGTVLNIVKITQSAYSALTSPSATTAYLISG